MTINLPSCKTFRVDIFYLVSLRHTSKYKMAGGEDSRKNLNAEKENSVSEIFRVRRMIHFSDVYTDRCHSGKCTHFSRSENPAGGTSATAADMGT